MGPEASPTPRESVPWVTTLLGLACTTAFVSLSLQQKPLGADQLAHWGWVPARAVWQGAVWGLLTNTIVHIEAWHLFFNMYWLWKIGRAVEAEIGAPRYLALVLLAAWFSSSAQLALGGSMGIGLSGVGYALFGYAWIARRRSAALALVVDQSTVTLFLLWLVGCFVATRMGIMNVANAAHAGGLAIGAALGALSSARAPAPAFCGVALAAFGIGAIPTFSVPWSADWNAQRAYEAALRRDYEKAIPLYRRSIDLGADPRWGWEGLAQVGEKSDRPDVRDDALAHLERLDPKAAQEMRARWRIGAVTETADPK